MDKNEMRIADTAQWIGSPERTDNTDGVEGYSISAEFSVESGGKAGFAVAARNRDNYVLIEADIRNKRLRAYRYSDNAWTDGVPSVTELGKKGGYDIPVPVGENGRSNIVISVDRTSASVTINGTAVVDNEKDFMPDNKANMPRERAMMMFGLNQLGSRAVYYHIRLENSDGTVYQEDDFSNETGVLSALGTVCGGRLTVDNEFMLVDPVPAVNLRKSFFITKPVKRACLCASAKGFYSAYINGIKVNDDFYAPGFTDYRKRIEYQVYDITDKLKSGMNVIGAIVGKGYYSGFVGYSQRPCVYGSRNYFIAALELEYDNGTNERIVTDGTWQFTDKGPVMNGDYQQGEAYDARMEFDWNDITDARWHSCKTAPRDRSVQPTNGVLVNEEFEFSSRIDNGAVIERVILPSAKYSENPAGHFIFDFGQNMVGTVRLTMRGERGKTIKLRYGEMRFGDGRLYTSNLRTAANTDLYTFKGCSEGETFIPEFTAHGFRYMEISGDGYILSKSDLSKLLIKAEGLVITNTPVVTGKFECSDPLINKLQHNIEWGQRGNSLLVYTDCPQRNERMGWTGDAQVFARTAAYNMDIRQFMKKWLRDLRDAQLLYNKNGAVPDTAPLGGDNRDDGCAGWGDAAVIVPWEMYLAYGDESFLTENYEMMSRWIEYQSSGSRQNYGVRTVDGKQVPEQSDIASVPYIQVQQRRGDHLSYDNSTPYIYSATAYAAHCADIMARTAAVLGKESDEAKYRLRFENIKRAFNEAWVCDDGSVAYWGEMSEKTPQGEVCTALDGSVARFTRYAEGTPHCPSQTAYALAIDFDLIPHEKLQGAARGLSAAIERNNGHLTVGFLGISHLIPALVKAGLTDTAFRLLQNKENPGWLYSVANGATTIWERWNSYTAQTGEFGDVSMNSFNHYAYGAVGEWLFGGILGITTSEEKGETGYRKIILKPTPGGSLTYAKGSYESVKGTISSSWRLEGECFIYSCTIPQQASARLYLPAGDVFAASENAVRIADENGRAVFELKSGSYSFKEMLIK